MTDKINRLEFGPEHMRGNVSSNKKMLSLAVLVNLEEGWIGAVTWNMVI